MQSLKIDVNKLDKTAYFQGKSALYADLTLMDNRDGQDQYGNDGFIVQDIGKVRRDKGERGPIVGNWKHIGQQRQQQAAPPWQQNNQPPQGDTNDPNFIPF